MPKDRRVNSSSFDRSMVSPYSCSSKISDRKNSKSLLHHVGDEKEWEDVRCPICMEQPHNAVLLLCSSREKGCRPFVCDTSYRHSNCFDQFKKSSAAANLHTLSEEHQCELVCPFCRGTITGWDVMHPARKFMNSKTRSCSSETCSFRGNYAELRKHARLEHPYNRPSEASPTRQSNWTVLEQQREIEDALIHQSDIDEYGDFDLSSLGEWVNDDFWSGRNGLPSLDDWVEDDFWSEGSFFDIPSGMSDVEDDLSLLSGLSMPFFSPYLSSHDDDMMDSGNSRSRDQPQQPEVSGSRSDGHLGNAPPSSESRSSSHSEDDTNVLRSIPDHRRGNDSLNLSSRSAYRRENGRTTVSSNRSSYHRAYGPASSRSRSNYSRENGSIASRRRSRSRSRSRYYRECSPERSRRRSSYHWEDRRQNSRSGSRLYRGTFVPDDRGYGARSYPGSSRLTRSDPGHRGD